jgi:hypothetical protein
MTAGPPPPGFPPGPPGFPPGPPGFPPGPPGFPPGPSGYTPPPAAPNNNLVWSILVTVLCCLPLGIASIVKSSQVNGLWAQGRYAQAQKAASDAKKFAIWGAVGGAILAIILFAARAHASAAVPTLDGPPRTPASYSATPDVGAPPSVPATARYVCTAVRLGDPDNPGWPVAGVSTNAVLCAPSTSLSSIYLPKSYRAETSPAMI